MTMTPLRRILRRSDGTAAVEAAIFMPIFMMLTFGITDVGAGLFARQLVNAAAQAGATYAVINSAGDCASLTGTCQNGIFAAMNAASGSDTFCTGSVCTASITGCTDGSPKCITVTATYPLTPILPSSVYTWAQVMNMSATVTVRIL
jgi:Flp pilus assembly protein TadG